ncbi:hypothetical protein FH972_019195 [Carpinus fangiana]|uniref:Uncharacterized protein n=1 Tax=Carpinus fangiana TaxID=176857 RepID=A0A5N6RPE0_9ROSI|nr:hypothetical protein FH972_019195 [Carpinus fangiana]
MMSSFPVKLMAAIVVAVFLLMGDIPTTSALVHYGGSRKSLWLVYSRDGSRKTVPREEDSSEVLNTSLRAGALSPPPSPIKNRQSSMRAAAPPPDQIQ